MKSSSIFLCLVLGLVMIVGMGMVSADTYLNFNGINSSLIFNLTNIPPIQTGNFSVSIWINLKNLGNGVGNQLINEVWNLGDTSSTNDLALMITHQVSGNVNFSRFGIHNVSSGGQINLDYCSNSCTETDKSHVTNGAIWNNNQWYNIVNTFDGTNMTQYVNGIKTNSFSNYSQRHGSRGINQANFFGIGVGWDFLYYTNASMDEIRIYNDSLNQARISEIYNSGRIIPNTSINSINLVTWLPFNESSGNFVYDYSGNGLTGNLNNTKWINSLPNGIFNGIIWNASSSSIINSLNGNTLIFNNIDVLQQYVYLSNLTSALLTNGTSIYNGSSSNLALNTGNVNITLNPNDFCYVLDNYNLTEGVNREYSPIWFSSSTSTEKHIASNLSDAVTILVITDIGDCETKNLVTYTTDTGVVTTWTGTQATDICNQFKTTGVQLTIEPATNSNILDWEDGTTNLARTILKLLVGFLALGILIVATGFFYLVAKDNFMYIDSFGIINYIVVVLITVILYIVLINYIVGLI